MKSSEYPRCRCSAQVAVEALRVDIVFAGPILDVAINEGLDRHGFSLENVRCAPTGAVEGMLK